MAEIKPISTLDAATTVADGDQIVLNVRGPGANYTTKTINPANFGAQIGPYLTIPYLPSDGGTISGELNIVPTGDETTLALQIGDPTTDGSSYFYKSGQIKISGTSTPWLDLEPAVDQAWDTTTHDIVLQVTNSSIPVFAVHEQGYTTVRGSVVVGDTSSNSSNLPGYIKTVANTYDGTDQSSDKAFTVQYGDESVAEVDYTGKGTFKSLHLEDDDKISFGTGDALQIFYTGTASKIRDQGPGNLIIEGGPIIAINNISDGAAMAKFNSAGAVEEYFNGVKKLETTDAGITVTGDVTATNITALTTDVGTNTSDIGTISTALTAIKAAAEDVDTDLAGLKLAIATALANF